MADLPKYSADKIRALRAMPYEEYLQTPWWRLRRHARLEKAHGKCERCGKVTSIADVHHVHYDRRGAERDTDLEVLCRDCHAGHHFDESRKQHTGQYEMLARETLRLDHPTSVTDFKEAFRKHLQKFDLPIDHRFDDTITIVWDRKQVSLVSEERRRQVAASITPTTPDLPPASHGEAVALLRRLGLKFPIRSMPEAYGAGTGVAAIRQRAENRLKGARCPQCRQIGRAQLSRVSPGWLFCTDCHHKWDLGVPA
jgi:hypothetical protein